MTSGRLFVGNLDFSAEEDDLRTAFAPFGDLVSVGVVLDRETGKPRGFGFVEYREARDAKAALTALDGVELRGRNLRVSEAKERASQGSSGTRGPRRREGL